MNDPALYERLKGRAAVSAEDCWLWTGALHSSGTPANACGRVGYNNKVYQAHRLMWIAVYGPIPAGRVICHECDHPRCINPDHLWLGTQAQNLRDAMRKGRHKGATQTHCKQGHPLSGENVRVTALQRVCLTCRAATNERWKARTKSVYDRSVRVVQPLK